MKVIGFNSNKGGNATSTSCAEIACALHELGYRVLVVDGDSQLSISKNITYPTDLDNVLSHSNLYDVLKMTVGTKDAIQETPFFDLIVGSQALDKAEKEFTEVDDIYLLADALSFVADDYDYVMIDSGPSKNFIQTSLLVASDYIIMNCEADASNYDALITTENELAKLTNSRAHHSHAKVMGYIMPKFEPNTNIAKIIYTDIETHMNERIAETKEDIFLLTVPKSVDMQENKSLKTLSCKSAKSSKCARAYYEIANKIIDLTKGE